jgi:small subunit ribosomal protein S11
MQAINKLLQSKQLAAFRILTSGVHTSRPCQGHAEDRKEMLRSMPKKDEGSEGEKSVSIDQLIQK